MTKQQVTKKLFYAYKNLYIYIIHSVHSDFFNITALYAIYTKFYKNSIILVSFATCEYNTFILKDVLIKASVEIVATYSNLLYTLLHGYDVTTFN